MHAGLFQRKRRTLNVTSTKGWLPGWCFRQATWPLLWLGALLLAVTMPRSAAAHELRPAIATMTVAADGQVEIDLGLNLEAAMAGVGPDHADTDDSTNAPIYDELRAMGPEPLRDAFSSFGGRLLEGISLSTQDGTPIELSVAALDVPEAPDLALARHSEVTLVGRLPEAAQGLVWRYDPAFGASVIRMSSEANGEVSYSEYLAAGAASQPIAVEGAERSALQVLANYVQVGFVHVLPLGLDHILFVVGLFLLSPRLSPLLWQVSAFTLAHTITLALGATGTVVLPSAPVETLIAASIAYVAIENLFTARLHAWRPVIVFGFGLLHGLGFAGVLAEVGLPQEQFALALIAFNIGVELAQITVIAGCFVIVGWAMRREWYRPAIVVPASAAIAALALYWVLQRSGLLA